MVQIIKYFTNGLTVISVQSPFKEINTLLFYLFGHYSSSFPTIGSTHGEHNMCYYNVNPKLTTKNPILRYVWL
jgi:hypothetical protein